MLLLFKIVRNLLRFVYINGGDGHRNYIDYGDSIMRAI